MANNYLTFSFEIVTTPEQREWLDKKMVETFDMPENPGPGFVPTEHQDRGRTFTLEHYDNSTVIYAEEYGDTDVLADILQEYMVCFDIEEPIGVEWAFTFSKMRPDEFGGGAFVVTKDDIQWTGTGYWITKQIDHWRTHGKLIQDEEV
jgi:hypothetical protein